MKRIISLITVTVMIFALLSSLAFVSLAEDDKPYFYDYAEVLTEPQRKELSALLRSLSKECGYDIVIAIDSEDNTDDYFETNYYDYLGYGTGSEHDGMLTVIIADGRWEGNTVISLAGKIGKKREPSDVYEKYEPEYKQDLAYGKYYEAVKETIDADRKFIEEYKESLGFKPVVKGFISVAVGFLAGFISTSVMKGKLKSVKKKTQAADYVVPGSFNLVDQRDIFLYANVTKTPIVRDEGSRGGGGGGVHVSSGGVSHNTGRF